MAHLGWSGRAPPFYRRMLGREEIRSKEYAHGPPKHSSCRDTRYRHRQERLSPHWPHPTRRNLWLRRTRERDKEKGEYDQWQLNQFPPRIMRPLAWRVLSCVAGAVSAGFELGIPVRWR